MPDWHTDRLPSNILTNLIPRTGLGKKRLLFIIQEELFPTIAQDVNIHHLLNNGYFQEHVYQEEETQK